ncbi:DUF6542 domain-containing protein [Corynebacterium mendelii]|uniref:DUF6542 domain-containing protein n=1 Tax=Corynebacterium mendelii TaxID=2765362 RepID=A0A939IUD3_9CORY|nr:DUF6542 domain-containing protein [Corynebacterium mendelii]MBN9644809.1 hypothetical protein [Corynebacterium mendelii]
MTHSDPQRPPQARPSAAVADVGVSPWIAGVILVLGTIAAAGMAVSAGQITTTYPIVFGCVAVGCVLITKTRAVTLLTALVPILFGIATPWAAGIIGRAYEIGDTTGVSKTQVLTALYPLAQFFPALCIITLSAVLVAVAKYVWVTSRWQSTVARLNRARAGRASSDRATVDTARRARRTAPVRAAAGTPPQPVQPSAAADARRARDRRFQTMEQLARERAARQERAARRPAAPGGSVPRTAPRPAGPPLPGDGSIPQARFTQPGPRHQKLDPRDKRRIDHDARQRRYPVRPVVRGETDYPARNVRTGVGRPDPDTHARRPGSHRRPEPPQASPRVGDRPADPADNTPRHRASAPQPRPARKHSWLDEDLYGDGQ